VLRGYHRLPVLRSGRAIGRRGSVRWIRARRLSRAARSLYRPLPTSLGRSPAAATPWCARSSPGLRCALRRLGRGAGHPSRALRPDRPGTAPARAARRIRLDDATIASIVAALGSTRRPFAVERARVDRQSGELALEHAAGALHDGTYLGRLKELPRQRDVPGGHSASGFAADRAVEWLRALGQSLTEADVPADKAATGDLRADRRRGSDVRVGPPDARRLREWIGARTARDCYGAPDGFEPAHTHLEFRMIPIERASSGMPHSATARRKLPN
jgi:hypothetical protein